MEAKEALRQVRRELWVDYCLQMGRTDVPAFEFNSRPHIRIIDAVLGEPPRKVRLERWAEIVDRVVVAYHHEPIAAGDGRIVVPFVLEYEEPAT